MYAIPTTTVSVLRGTTTDDLGDVIDNLTVAASGIVFSLIEQRKTVFVPSANRLQQVMIAIGRGPADMDVTAADRIKDERSGLIYVIDNVSRVQSPVTMNDVRLDLRRASTS
jgi:hypothetical protein